MIPHFKDVLELLGRSYSYKLVMGFIDQYDQNVYGKLDFSLLQQRQEYFDHIAEVFEQDLRLGEETAVAIFCQENPVLVLLNILFVLVSKSNNNSVADNLALKGLISDSEAHFASQWLSEN